MTPDVIVVQSGRNDIGFPLAALRAAVRATLFSAHARWPHAQVVVLGAIPFAMPLGAGILGVEAIVKQVTADTHTGLSTLSRQVGSPPPTNVATQARLPRIRDRAATHISASRLAPALKALISPTGPFAVRRA